jgi:twinkle protein
VQSVFAEAQTIIFSTDNDRPGHKLRDQLALIFGKEKCKYINYPVGYKDINDVFKGNNKSDVLLPALGKAGVDECYQNLSSFPVKGIVRPQDVREELEMIASDGFTPGLGIGTPEIDEMFTLKRKHFTVITGIPKMGKSVFIRWYLSEFIRHNDKENIKWAMFTPENRPVSREQAKIAEAITGQSFRRNFKNSMSEEVRAKTMRYIQKHFFFISPNKLNFETWTGKVDSDHVNSMESLLQYLIYLKKTENIFGFVIDAWNKIEHEQPKNQTETTFISKQLDHLINFCDVYDMHCILIAHPTKIEKVGINYRMPCLYDIKGSSAWNEKADIGIVIHRYLNKKRPNHELPDDPTEDDKIMFDKTAPSIIYVEKIRFEELGSMGKIRMRMDYAKGGRFFVIDEKAKKAEPPDISGKLNPKQVEEDEVFTNNDNGDALPF